MRPPAPSQPAARFAIVGCTNFCVSFAVFYLCFNYLPEDVRRHLPDGALANLLAYVAGMVNSFLLNRSWTFRISGDLTGQAVRFALVNLVSLSLSTLAVYEFVDVLGLPAFAVWVPVTLVVMTLNYLGCKHWAFAQPALRSGKSA
jgi:putative flippase GtrA